MSSRSPLWTSLVLCLLPLLLGALPAGGSVATFFWGNPKPQGNGLQGVAFEDASTGYAVGIHGTCLVTIDGGATWTDQTDFAAFTADLMDVLVLGPGELLAVGASPGIFRSTDGGQTWSPVANPSSGVLNEISRVSGSILSAVGESAQVLRSTDEGATWVALSEPAGNSEIVDQYWRSATEGYVLGPFLLRRTTNGGTSWNVVPGTSENNFFPGDIQFLDESNGWILVDFTTYRTTNGGASWFEKHGPINQSPIYQEEALIVSAEERYVVTEAEGAEIWRTVDDGLHWTRLYQRDATRGYTEIRRLPNGDLVVVSSDGDLLRSTNAGASWVNFTASPGDANRVPLSAITFLPGGKGFAGGGGLYMESVDGGRTWQEPAAEPHIQGPNVIHFRDDLLGIVGGYGTPGTSEVSRTSDGGATWTVQTVSSSYVGYVTDLDIVGVRCYAALHGGSGVNSVYASTDAGLSWFPATTGIPANGRVQAIDFVDAMTGYVGGEGITFDAGIYRTTNGGQGWSVVTGTGLPSDMVLCMKWFDAQTGLIGSFGGVHRTTNAGSSWSRVMPEEASSLSFLNATEGYATSLFDRAVWRTEDAGMSWERLDLPWSLGPNAVAAIPGGFVGCGAASVLLGARVLDPAATGSPVDPRARGSLLAGDLGNGVSVRAASRLATDGPIRLVIDARSAPVPAAGVLGSVLDLEGRRVAALAMRPLGPAVWEAVWDGKGRRGGDAAPGVYFLALERGGRRGAVKCVRLP
jgi:photosystem II stability/assembly factor-like uncharacterized protein